MNSAYMKLAINAATRSRDQDGYWVGAVIIRNGQILSLAHSDEKENKGHAEELAIQKYGGHLSGAIMYATLEPCDLRSTSRKSCCDLIIESGISKVIYGVLDPRKECMGVEKLVSAGIEVEHFKQFEEKCKKITPNLKFS